MGWCRILGFSDWLVFEAGKDVAMKMPWDGKSGLAKAAIICSFGLLVSTGLCGVNIFAMSRGHDYPGAVITLTGIVELFAMGGLLLG